MKLNLLYNEYHSGGGICEGQENDSWPSYEDTYIDWELTDCKITRSKYDRNVEEVDVPFVVVPGDQVFVVFVRYQTGGTFATTIGAWNIVGVYKDHVEALAIFDSIHDGSYPKQKNIYVPWLGYFERFEDCVVQCMNVRN